MPSDRILLFQKRYVLVPDSAHESSLFSPVNILAQIIKADVENRLLDFHNLFPTLSDNPLLPKEIKECRAYSVFDESLIEFINNSNDAEATELYVSLFFLTEKKRVEFSLIDNGNGQGVSSENEFYDWQKFINPSPKAILDENGSLCRAPRGQHLALAINSYYLRSQNCDGGLKLIRRDSKTILLFYSNLTPVEFSPKSAQYQFGKIRSFGIVVAMLIEFLISKDPKKQTITPAFTEKTFWYDVEIFDHLCEKIGNKSRQIQNAIQEIRAKLMGGNSINWRNITLNPITVDQAIERIKKINRQHYFVNAPEQTSIAEEPASSLTP